MGDNNWWFNRAGRIAPASNPGSAVPNYALTYDLATAPAGADEFDNMASAINAYMKAPSSATAAAVAAPPKAPDEHQSLWDHAKHAAGGLWDFVTLDDHSNGPKAGDKVYDLSNLSEQQQADVVAGKLDAETLGAKFHTVKPDNVMDAPGVKQIFWGLDKVNEYASTAMLASTLAEDDSSLLFKSGTWGDAHALTKERHLNAGEAFMQMFYDKEMVQDKDRFEQIRQHSTVFNTGALAFNIIGAWKADPNVLLGRGVGAARDLAGGKLAVSGRTREVQREVLSQPTMDAAKAHVETYTGLADRLRGMHAVSLYDRAQSLRAAAQEMGFEEFKNLPTFRTTASGTTLAGLFRDVATDDEAWNLVFRSAIGDPTAIDDLLTKRADLSDRIAAIEMKTMPRLQADLERVQARYAKRLAEQGKPQDARIEITRFGDKWLEDSIQSLRAESDALTEKLATFDEHESWMQRTLPGLDEDTGTLSGASPNSIFGGLDRISRPRGTASMWARDEYSPTSYLLRAPGKPLLKRVGAVSLNDVDEGGEALVSYLDQLDFLQGGVDQAARDKVLHSWASASHDVERRAVVERVEREAITALGVKHGLSPQIMDRLGKELQDKRRQTWSKFTDATMYSPVRGTEGKMIEYVENGNKVAVKMPLDVTQLPNWHSLTNLTDLDRTIRENRDVLRSMDADLANRLQAGTAWTRRHTMQFVEEVGSTFNAFWKPLALLSIRWPTRVVADESMRVMALTGILPHLAQWKNAAGNAIYNAGAVRPIEWWGGRKVRTGSLAEESLRAGTRSDFDAYDYRAITNPTAAVPADVIDFGKIDNARYDKLNAKTAERWQYLRSVEARRYQQEQIPASARLAGAFKRNDPPRPDDEIVVFHTTTPEAAARLRQEGARPGSKVRGEATVIESQTVADALGKKVGDQLDYEPGRGIGDGLYVTRTPQEGAQYGTVSIPIRVRAGDLATAPERPKRLTPWESLFAGDGYLPKGASVSQVFENVEDALSGITPRLRQAAETFAAEPQRPRWATQWDERLTEAQDAPERGFFFDPVTHQANRKGFAVSVYPGRLRTFDRKPTARELNYWTEKNSDLLAIPHNRVAVWHDKDTGRWHLDVVKTAKRREDAMLLAQRADASEFYDIEDGFTRYLSEDFWQHYSSPFTKADEPKAGGPGGVAYDQAPLSDESGAEIGEAFGASARPQRKAVGFGTAKWRSRDGKVVEGERVFGKDTSNPNVYYGVVSSREAIHNLYGGHTKHLGIDRRSRVASDYRVFDGSDPDLDPKDWATAYAGFVNDHMKFSPVWQRMAEGQTDDQIYEWLMGSAAGRSLRKRIGVRGENPHRWVSDLREIHEHMFPNERVLQAAREGDLTPEQVLHLIPEAQRMTVHGDTIKLALGTAADLKTAGRVIESLMGYLGSVPTDALVRHPFAENVYQREMRNYLSSVPADKVTNNVLAAAEASARAEAVRRIRKTLYNIADEREGIHMLRFVSPFFQAQMEVLERWAKISMEKPETFAHLAQILAGSQVLPSPFWHVTDRDGKTAKGYHADNTVVFQVTDTMRGIAKKLLPGDPLKYAKDMTVPVSSLNLMTGGENPFLPSLGPLVILPASEFYYKDRPELEDTAIYKWAFPFGQPRGDNFVSRTLNSVAPAYARRLMTAETADFSDSAFARRASEIGAQQQMEWEKGGRVGPRPTPDDALEAAKNEYRLRAASSFFLPAPVTPRSPYQFWIDQYRQYKQRYGRDADEKFYDDYGPDYYLFAQQSTEALGGMGPDTGEKRAYNAYKGLIARAPDLLGVLTGPYATGEFSDSVYQWQLATKGPNGQAIRTRLTPEERIADAEAGRGWVEYGKLSSALDAELRSRAAAGGSPYLSAKSNADLKAIKDAKMMEIIERNPAWQDAYISRTSKLGSWLGQAYDVAFDHALDSRTDMQTLRAYLIGRARLQDALIERKANGLASSDQLSFDPLGNPIGDNADLAYAWMSWVDEAKSRNPLFADIYNRYLEGDDLSIYIPAGVSGG